MKKYMLLIIMAALGTAALFAQTPEDQAWAEQIRREAAEANGEYNNPVMEEDAAPEAPFVEETPPQKKKGVPYPYRRYFEFGVNNVGAGFANNFLGIGDILRKQIVVNRELFEKIKTDGFMVDADVDADAFINLNTRNWGVDITASVAGDVGFQAPKSLFTLLVEGNKDLHSSSGTFSVYGAVYAEAAVDIHTRLLKSKRLKISVIPSLFIPMLYIPKNGFSYNLIMERERALFSIDGALDVYTPFSMDTLMNDSGNIDYMSILDAKGFDLSLNAEYDAFKDRYDWLTVGFNVKSIPIAAANLQYRAHVSLVEKPWNIIDTDDLIGGLAGGADGLFNLPDSDDITFDYSLKGEIAVKRPVRFDLYSNIRPFGTKIVVVRSSIGLTVANALDGKRHFNYSLTAELNTPVFLLRLFTAYDELVYKHGLMIGLNLRLVEVDVGLDVRSRDLARSLDLSGVRVWAGARIGI
ncbi:MAG: hypothetical protein LBG43_00945 [Treponema sp.]|jgi:hypothetical protein|nr:hypothetical protein [Treponema sp.]